MYESAIADKIWNRACQGGGGFLCAGDVALAALLKFHGEAMNGGVLHATECLSGVALTAAQLGYGYFGFEAIVDLIAVARNALEQDQDLDKLEESLDQEYDAEIPDDETLVTNFRNHLKSNPDQYTPIATPLIVEINDYVDELGEPDLTLAGLKLWIHGYQFRESLDRWDGNWLNATAVCSEGGASVLVQGHFIRTDEIAEWQSAVEKLGAELMGEARLQCMEPNIAITLKAMSLGAVDMEVRITPNQSTQDHKFRFQIDQSYLKPLSAQCARVMHAFPLRGS